MLGGLIPFDIGVLPEVSDVFVCDVAVKEKVGQVLMLRLIGSVELVSMKVKPSEDLLLRRQFLKVWCGSPEVGWSTDHWCKWILRGAGVGIVCCGGICVGS